MSRDSLENGLTFLVASENEGNLASRKVEFTCNTNFYKGLTASGSEDHEGRDDASPSAVLPRSLFRNIGDEYIDLIFGAFASPVLFQNTELENTPFEVASVILTISLNQKVENLVDDVVITLPLLSEVSIVILQAHCEFINCEFA